MLSTDCTDPNFPATTLLILARRAGLRLRAIAARPGRLLCWGPRTAETDRIALAIERRADEIARLLPPNLTIPADDEGPETLAGDLPLGVLRAMVIAWVHDAVAVIDAERAWEAQIAGRDAPAAHPTRQPRRTFRLEVADDST